VSSYRAAAQLSRDAARAVVRARARQPDVFGRLRDRGAEQRGTPRWWSICALRSWPHEQVVHLGQLMRYLPVAVRHLGATAVRPPANF
jgi:hypothetical protein